MNEEEDQDPPLLVLSGTFSSNPLSRFLSRIQLTGFTLVLAVPLAAAIALVIPATSLMFGGKRANLEVWFREQWWVVLIILACCWVFVHFCVFDRRRREGSLGVFANDDVLLRRAPARDDDLVARHRMPYSDIGSIGFTPPLTVAFRFGPEDSPGLELLDIRLLRYTAEDEYDHLIALFAEQAPEHVFSILEESTVRYSRAWDLSELWPGDAEVHAASIGIGTILQPDVEASIDGELWHFSLRTGWTRRDGDEDWLLQQDVNQVLSRKGMVVCQSSSTRPGRYEIEFGSGELVSVRTVDCEIDLDHETVGTLAISDDEVSVRFHSPVSTLIALVVVVAVMRAEYANRNL